MKKIAIFVLVLVVAIAVFACVKENKQKEEESEEEMFEITTLTDLTADSYYQNGFTTNYIVGIDQFSRTFQATANEKSDKTRSVGLFYFMTLGQHGAEEVRDVSKILEQEDGMELLFYTDNETCPKNESYFWGEPLFGYYNSADYWVIRRHLSLLYSAGVDFLVLDTTNGVTYDTVVARLAQTILDMQEQGFDAPKLVYYTNTDAANVVDNIYERFFSKSKYDSVWFRIDGKPLIIVPQSVSQNASEKYKEYFYFRATQWPTEDFIEDGFPWIEWTYPAPVHNDVINVAVAAHPQLPMSFSLTRGAKNWGRGWNVETQENESDKAYEGQFFQSTWDVAIEKDPGIVFVTGWNEWCAGKFEYDGEYAMIDLCNMEFSRDAEMMVGGYNDAFYMQLAANIRKYKNVNIEAGSQLESTETTIPMTEDLSAWDNVKAIFREGLAVNKARNSKGTCSKVYYKTAAARNFVREMRVAQDSEYFYFYIKQDEDIVLREDGDSTWMNIFIGTKAVETKGWECYEFVIGRQDLGNGKLSVEALNSDYTGNVVGECEYLVTGNVMQVKVARSLLGISAGENQFYFKLADGVENPSDIMDYYVTGRSFPMGRLSYQYLG